MNFNIPKINKGKTLVHSWVYYDKEGDVIGVVGRYQNGDKRKDIVPFFNRNDNGGIYAGIELIPRPLFGLDRIAIQPKEQPIFIVEGEKTAAAMQGIGLMATTSIGGANAAKQADWTPLNGFKTVYILPDNNKAGEVYAKDVYNVLMALEFPSEIKVVRLPDLPDGGDFVDWAQGYVNNWDGYNSLESEEGLKDVFYEVLNENTLLVPIEWKATDTATVSNHQWGVANDIGSKIPPVMHMPIEFMPEPYRPWLADVSSRMQTPPDFVAISAIVVASSVIGAGCGIYPKQHDKGWSVIPNLWGAVIAPPSSLKTPTMSESIGMLDKLKKHYDKKTEVDHVAAEFDNNVFTASKSDITDKITKAVKSGSDNAVIASLRQEFLTLSENKPPMSERRIFKVNETSTQAMTKIQSGNPRGVLMFSDELVALLAKWDKDDNKDERAYYLAGWNGDGSYTDAKIGRGNTEADQICISLLGGIQPDKLQHYLYQTTKGGNDGLLQRLQLAVWPDIPDKWEFTDQANNKDAKRRVYDIVEKLAELNFKQYGALKNEDNNRPYFSFSNEAQAVFNDWLIILDTEKLRKGENPLIEQHLAKYRSLMPSLALIFHCIDIADGKATGNVSETATLLAVRWCNYLETHARRIYAMAVSPEYEAALKLAAKIKERKLTSPFTAKHVYDKTWYGLSSKQEVEAACNVLIDENWLIMTRTPSPSGGGRPLIQYHINPTLI